MNSKQVVISQSEGYMFGQRCAQEKILYPSTSFPNKGSIYKRTTFRNDFVLEYLSEYVVDNKAYLEEAM